MAKQARWVYFFGNGKADGRGDQKDLLGGKGAGLAEMTRIGLPVPPGFTITTKACAAFSQNNGQWPAGLDKQVRRMITQLERATRKKLGSPKNPLLVSVRSGSARSMPGMMETILNLGLNDETVEGLAALSDNRRFALDAYRRLIMMYGSTARHIAREHFETAFADLKESKTRARLGKRENEKVVDTDVDAEELGGLVEQFKNIYLQRCGELFPQDPYAQLQGAIDAVFRSWMSEKAVTYRRVENITGLHGTAVNVCQMVFGNMGDDSGTGVCFTRDPSTGEAVLYGDMLINAQGEDVVAGVRTPIPLAELESLMPDVYDQLEAVRVMLEVHYKEMQDLEFTIERGKLYMLQCRVGKRSPQAAFKIAVEQATKGLMSRGDAARLVRQEHLPKKYAATAARPTISRDEAIRRISAQDVERLFYPVLDPDLSIEELARRELGEGIGAVPGAAAGEVMFTAADAQQRAGEGGKVILVRKETSPEDVGGMHAAAGILTATGGKTSHAAVVARGWGKCCVVGCEELQIDYGAKKLTLNGRGLQQGDWITLDGGSGRIFDGQIPLVRPDAPLEFATLMSWCDARRRLQIRANADTPADALRAVELGAEGIGLCRTEHMFFDSSQPQRIRAVREMILADSPSARQAALDKLLPFQIGDFEGIFRAMDGRPVTIRLLDPPLHEFLPDRENIEGVQAVVDELNAPVLRELRSAEAGDQDHRRKLESKLIRPEDIRRRVDELHEANPMLGHRGCRLCISFPEILDMQVRAIIEAAVRCRHQGVSVAPEIMIPLSIDPRELAVLIHRTHQVADEVLQSDKARLPYLVGTMIETPRAALLAGSMAKTAEFFSFGTNDLTQLVMCLSRDDAGKFLPAYLAEKRDDPSPKRRADRVPEKSRAGVELQDNLAGPILSHDPFQTIDEEGVGALVRSACECGRAARSKMKLGICGEHGGDPASIHFFAALGVDYVSCSPLRIPVARLAAAQAALVSTSGGRSARRNSPRLTTSKRPKKASPRGRRHSAAVAERKNRTRSLRVRRSATAKTFTRRGKGTVVRQKSARAGRTIKRSRSSSGKTRNTPRAAFV